MPADHRRILLINPNSSEATTAMMVGIAASAAAGFDIVGATATRAPPMIVSLEALEAAAAEVVDIADAHHNACDGLIVSAFGDPGLAAVKARIAIPAVGIGESSMREAASGGRRFGVATSTHLLGPAIDHLAVALGLSARYTGVRFTACAPLDLMRDPPRLRAELAEAVQTCLKQDGAEAVIIGGGPLGQVAIELQHMFAEPIIAPVPAAVTRLVALLNGESQE